MVDGDVVSKGAVNMVLLLASVESVNHTGAHRDNRPAVDWSDIEGLQAVPPMRKCAVRPLRQNPRLAGRQRKFVSLTAGDGEGYWTAHSTIGSLHDG